MPLKVFYLDDEIELCELFSDYFESDEVSVSTFTDPEVAIAVIKATPPDIFFTDYRLPETTGDDVAHAIDPKIPKYLITGESSVEVTYKFEKIFEKPLIIEEVFKLIQMYISQASL